MNRRVAPSGGGSVKASLAGYSIILVLIVGCAGARRAAERPSAPPPVLAGHAALYGRVIARIPNPLAPGGASITPVAGAQIMLYRPSFADIVSPGTYPCEFERFVVGDQVEPYLLRTGWVSLSREDEPIRGRLTAAIPPPPPLTDYTGRFVLTALSPGRYVLEIAAERHRHRFVEFSLPDSSVTHTFLTEETFLDLLPEYEVEP